MEHLVDGSAGSLLTGGLNLTRKAGYTGRRGELFVFWGLVLRLTGKDRSIETMTNNYSPTLDQVPARYLLLP
jgi:hypothetical protein